MYVKNQNSIALLGISQKWLRGPFLAKEMWKMWAEVQ